MATDISTRPQWLNANTLIYNAWDLRRYMDGDPPGPGVADYESFRVLPRQAGANLSVDVGKTSPGLMQAWVRGSTREGQGLYRVDNIDVTAPSASTYLAQLNVAVTSNASGNPRLDQVVLVIGDTQHAGATNKAYIDVIAGTPTGGATLDNRTGATALPASCILLADILLASGDATVDAADIRDRRPFPLYGTVPPLPLASGASLIDIVGFQAGPGLNAHAGSGQSWTMTPGTLDNMQSAALMFLPRRIKGATRIRWGYSHGATPATSNYNIAICDASGRLIVATGATAFTGIAFAHTAPSLTITATDFEPGAYYVWFGVAALTASSAVGFDGVSANVNTSIPGVSSPGVFLRSASGGTTFPAANTILGYADVNAVVPTTFSLPVPKIALSVG